MSTDPIDPGTVFAAKPCGPIVQLKIVGGAAFDTTALPSPYAIGRVTRPGELPRAEVQLPSPQVSQVHGVLEQRGPRLWYRDQRSTNGTYVRNAREDEFVLTRGMIFRVADVSMIALDALQVALRPRLRWALGLDDEVTVDHTLAQIAQDDALLIVGPAGYEAEALARAIHDSSGRRDYPFQAFRERLPRGGGGEERLRAARWGTVFIDLRAVGEVMMSFAQLVHGRREPLLHLRPIISVGSVSACHKLLGQMASEHAITVPPLVERRHEVPRLIELAMREQGATCGLGDLPATWPRAALTRRSWTRAQTLESLREVARRLRALIEHRGHEGAAAAALGMTRQNLNAWLRRQFVAPAEDPDDTGGGAGRGDGGRG